MHSDLSSEGNSDVCPHPFTKKRLWLIKLTLLFIATLSLALQSVVLPGTSLDLLVDPMVRRDLGASSIVSQANPSHLPVIWTKNNPTPWNTIKPDENTKLMSVNQKFEKR